MGAYSAYQSQVVTACIVFATIAVVLVPFLKRGGAPTRLLGISLVVAVIGILGFSLAGYASRQPSSPGLDVTVKYLKNVPITAAVSYACLVQARRYSLSHRTSWVHRTLMAGPYIVWAGFLFTATLDVWRHPPVLEVTEPLSLWSTGYNAAFVVPLAFYSGFTACVFLKAINEPVRFASVRNRLRRNLQNVCSAMVMGGFAFLAVSTYAWYCGRSLLPEQALGALATTVSRLQAVSIAVLSLALLVGIVSYCSQDDYEKLMEHLANITQPICDLTEILAAAPVFDSGLNKPYAHLKQAVGKEFLDLSESESNRADDAFRAGALINVGWRSKLGGDYESIKSADLLNLAKMHDAAPASTYATLQDNPAGDVPTTKVSQALDTSGETLYKAIAFVTNLSSGRNLDTMCHEEHWAQVAALALAEARALPDRISLELMAGNHVSENVYHCYSLAQLKLKVDRY